MTWLACVILTSRYRCSSPSRGCLGKPIRRTAGIAGRQGRRGASISSFASIAVAFPGFTDGRGYSTARLLVERYKYQGELRAVGDVLNDQIR